MAFLIRQLVIAVVLVGGGWSIGRAQVQEADFELVVEAPAGETIVTCRRGCELVWVERGINPAARRKDSFSFRCGGTAPPAVCVSGRIGGWITR